MTPGKPLLTLLFTLTCHAANAASGPCPPAVPTPGQYGPYDYTNPADFSERLPVVEQHHLTPKVQNLLVDNEHPPGQHLDYILRAFPNHYRALELMSRLSQKEGTQRPSGANFTLECYFERAMTFSKNDPMVMMLQANHLHRNGQRGKAIEIYEKAITIRPNDPTLNYNIGLAYFDAKNYSKSLQHARIAYQQGYPLPGLRKKLQRVGQWK